MATFRVTKNGKELDNSLYTWDEHNRVFSTNEDSLVLNFWDIDNCTFNTGWNCIFKTGSNCTFNTGSNCTFNTGDSCIFYTGWNCTFYTGGNCTFKTGSNCTFKTGSSCIFKTGNDCTFDTIWNCTFNTGNGCTFKTGSDCVFKSGNDCTFETGGDCIFKTVWNCTFDTGSDCTFDTGSYCTFNTDWNCTFKAREDCKFTVGNNCVLIRKDIFEFYDISNKSITTTSYKIKGYVENGYYYVDNKKQYEAIIVDGILSEIIKKRGNVYHVKNYGAEDVTYLVTDGENYSHGKTLKQAKGDLIYKISNRSTSQYNDYTLDTELTKEEAIKMYRVMTGACELGTKYFCKNHKIPKKLTVRKVIELTDGQYNHEKLVEFFKRK